MTSDTDNGADRHPPRNKDLCSVPMRPLPAKATDDSVRRSEEKCHTGLVGEAEPDSNKGIPRPIEVLAAIAALVAVAPLILCASLAILLTGGGPVLFKQQRIGRNGRGFTLLKLRTMAGSGKGPQVTAHNDSRVTPVGRFLRKAKIDELPELWNVIRGDMSLVGPRPEVPRFVDLGDPRWQRILRVRPGLTDPVTIGLRNEEDLFKGVAGNLESFYSEFLQPLKLSGYLEFLEQRNWKSDIAVIFKTIVAVVRSGKTATVD
jgi:lipopolysaccharide/colanic/teichoic acid biosynthesis glycosyltransferase